MNETAPPSQAEHDRALAISDALLAEWVMRVSSGVTSSILELYDRDALFFGSNPRFYLGQSGIKAYFDEVDEGYLQKADFHDREARFITPDIVVFSSYVDFTLFENAVSEVQFFRITFCFQNNGDRWKIVQQHASRIMEAERRSVVRG